MPLKKKVEYYNNKTESNVNNTSFYEEVDDEVAIKDNKGQNDGIYHYYSEKRQNYNYDKNIPITQNEARLLRIEYLAESASHKLEAVTDIKELLQKSQREQKRKSRLMMFCLLSLFSISFVATLCTYAGLSHAQNNRPFGGGMGFMGEAGANRDCLDCLDNRGNPVNGDVYAVMLPQSFIPTLVRCDMNKMGGGWTVIQRRGQFGNAKDFFHRMFDDYESGFGDLEGEFWLGLKSIRKLLRRKQRYELMIEVTEVGDEGVKLHALFDNFTLGEPPRYELRVSGHSGTLGDALTRFSGSAFSAEDKDQDGDKTNCARRYKSGWWFSKCGISNLNGLNFNDENAPYMTKGIAYVDGKHGGRYSYSAAEMKIRRKTD